MFVWNSSLGYVIILCCICSGIVVMYPLGYIIWLCVNRNNKRNTVKNNVNISTALIDNETYVTTSSDEDPEIPNKFGLTIIIPP